MIAVPFAGSAGAMAAVPGTDPDLRPLVSRATNGPDAVTNLGAAAAGVASRQGRTVDQLRGELAADPTLWLDRTGQLFAVDPAPPAGSAAAEPAARGPYPNSQTFLLHSNPTSKRKIYLDFDGQTVSGTAWNDSSGVSTTPQPALDLDGSPGSWSQAEHDLVQSVFQRVAEDYAPFDVDVTTQDPGTAGLERSSSSDDAYGTRVLITPSSQAHQATCGGGCGGIAFIGSYDSVGRNTYYQPAWVFSQALGNDAKGIAEAATHEAGHNLGLAHDGTASTDYYSGHRMWAPIMGVGYNRPLVQWSKGEYSGANNKEDDFAVIGSHGLPARADDAGNTPAAAKALGASVNTFSGVISRRTDKDVLKLALTCTGTTKVTVRPAPLSPNLDAQVRLLDASGAALAVGDPASGRVSSDVASGLNATVSVATRPGTYYVEIDGVGNGTGVTGYTDYGSVGAYTARIARCT